MSTKIVATLVRDGVTYVASYVAKYDRAADECEYTADGVVVEDLPGPTIQRQADGSFSRGYTEFVACVLQDAIMEEIMRLVRKPRSERVGTFHVTAHEEVVG
jgi:hypothetical protein